MELLAIIVVITIGVCIFSARLQHQQYCREEERVKYSQRYMNDPVANAISDRDRRHGSWSEDLSGSRSDLRDWTSRGSDPW